MPIFPKGRNSKLILFSLMSKHFVSVLIPIQYQEDNIKNLSRKPPKHRRLTVLKRQLVPHAPTLFSRFQTVVNGIVGNGYKISQCVSRNVLTRIS